MMNELDNAPEEVEEVEQEHVEEAELQENEQEPEQKPAQQSWKEVNQKLKAQQEEMDRIRRERDLYAQHFDRATHQQPQQQQEPEDDFNIDSLPDDDIAEYGAIKKTRRKDQVRLKKIEERLVYSEMKSANKDFDDVFNADNIRRLGQEDPLLAKTLLMNPNLEDQVRMTYNAIKRYGIHKDNAQKEDHMVTQYNTSRPKSSNSVAPSQKKSALGQAGAFSGRITEEMKQEIYKNAKEKAQGWNF